MSKEASPFPRASLFLASRLASVVQKFRHRLQQKVRQKRRSPNPFGASYQRGIRLRALSDLERCAPHCRLSVADEPRSAVEHRDHGKWISELLGDLHDHSLSPTFSLTRVAADDKLLLSPSSNNLIEILAQHATVPQAAYMFDSSTFLIAKLEALRSDKFKSWAEPDADCQRLKEESYLANLLHLLRQLQQLLFQILVHRSLSRLDEFALHWQKHWQQQKKLGEDWFAEWPSGERLPSTTWPWNIRPSLVVLWGVNWQFYTPEQKSEDNARSPAAQQLVDESVDWPLMDFAGDALEQGQRVDFAIDPSSVVPTSGTQAQAQASSHLSPITQATTGRNLNMTNPSRFSALAQPHSSNPDSRQLDLGISHFYQARQGDVDLTALHSTSSSLYPPPASTHSTALESRDFLGWMNSTSGDIPTSYESIQQVPLDVWSAYNQQGPPTYPPQSVVPTFQVSPVEGHNYVPTFDPIARQNPYPPFPRSSFSHNQDMGACEDYPSPHSERGRQQSITTSSSMPESVVADHITTPSSAGSKGLQISIKRGEPPRDAQSEIYCAHPECAQKSTRFRRVCEWNKHMDKHDRPYRCLEPGCDKVQGFTYSGGLLRHQREVHKKNKSSGGELYCRFPNCNRSTSSPFTRQENLKEHIRRRHVESVTISPIIQSVMATPTRAARSIQDRPRKRKRTTSTDFDSEVPYLEEESGEEDDVEGVKWLRKKIEQKDNRIRELEAELAEVREELLRSRHTAEK